LGGSVEYWEEEYYEPEKNPRLDPDQVYVVEEDPYAQPRVELKQGSARYPR